ncbi:hypothetical protein [Stenotrophomonas sp.]|uniref:hypothetical protein n=1 Tax=Stenotrophomonas sp. TaxID=69392 RepID=UPI0028AE2DAA|nr:hypothetical protein [Stenotrophomonas sp.]
MKRLKNGDTILPGSKLSSRSRELVPTAIGRPSRGVPSRYDSGPILPDIELVFDRLLNTIRSIHNERPKHPKPFEVFWLKICRELQKEGNASIYLHKVNLRLSRRFKKKAAMQQQLVEAFSNNIELPDRPGFSVSGAPGKVSERQEELKALRPEATPKTEQVLGIAAAFWIEARNAHNSNDPERALYALMECTFYVGIASGPRTASERASDLGSIGANTHKRDAIARIAIQTLATLPPDKKFKHPYDLAAEISNRICKEPIHAEAVMAYDSWSNRAGNAQSEVALRLANTILNWGTKDSDYLEFRNAFQKLARRAVSQLSQR